MISNHRSFLDPFLIGVSIPWSRQLHFMAKAELFTHPTIGWFLSRCGAFPVRRGESDEEATLTAQTLLEKGKVVALFPEGTRIRYGGLGKTKRGAGRLALLTGENISPMVVTGSEKTRKKILIIPRHCRISIEPTFPGKVDEETPEKAIFIVDSVWMVISARWYEMGGSKEPGTKLKPATERVVLLEAREKAKKLIRRATRSRVRN